jgi:hypothetical protein
MQQFLQGFLITAALVDLPKAVSMAEVNIRDVADKEEALREKMFLDRTYTGLPELNELQILREYYHAMVRLFKFVIALPEKKE